MGGGTPTSRENDRFSFSRAAEASKNEKKSGFLRFWAIFSSRNLRGGYSWFFCLLVSLEKMTKIHKISFHFGRDLLTFLNKNDKNTQKYRFSRDLLTVLNKKMIILINFEILKYLLRANFVLTWFPSFFSQSFFFSPNPTYGPKCRSSIWVAEKVQKNG